MGLHLNRLSALGWLTLNAFTASDNIIVVVSTGYFELDSIVQIDKTILKVKEEFNPALELLGMLFNLSDNTNATTASLQLLRQTYPNKVFRTIIPRNTDLKEAQLSKKIYLRLMARRTLRSRIKN